MSDQRPSRIDLAALGVFGLSSAFTVALGALGLALHGAPTGTWSRNPAAWLAGMTVGGVLTLASRRQAMSAAVIVVAIAALGGTLFAADQSGVHRWIDVGPLHVNIAALLLPPAIVALATLGLQPVPVLAIIAAIGALLLAQPDASQATAFLLAAAVIFGGSGPKPALLASGLLGMTALGVITWLRFDPLQPVPEVEGIFALLGSLHWALAAAASFALAATSLVPLRRRRSGDPGLRSAAFALTAYFAATAMTPLLGAYPVPLVGLGMSFPVGYWLGMALLAADGPCNEKRVRP